MLLATSPLTARCETPAGEITRQVRDKSAEPMFAAAQTLAGLWDSFHLSSRVLMTSRRRVQRDVPRSRARVGGPTRSMRTVRRIQQESS